MKKLLLKEHKQTEHYLKFSFNKKKTTDTSLKKKGCLDIILKTIFFFKKYDQYLEIFYIVYKYIISCS